MRNGSTRALSRAQAIDLACLKFPDGKIDFASAAKIKGELAISSG
jgi:hypothetical protein